MKIKMLALSLLAASAMLLSSCAEADITVTRGQGSAENKFPETETTYTLTVNISSGTFHLDEECRYARNMDPKNKKIICYSEIKTAMTDGYKPCSACAGEYKTTEENNG